MSVAPDGGAASRLKRRLGIADAVTIGLGAMIGAGVFSAVAPATAAAGSWVLVALACAAAVAALNALSMAQLAAVHPESGGAYAYGRKRLGDFWGFLAGWGFVVGKTASCAAMALTFGHYLDREWAHPIAVGAVAVITVVNCLGVEKTAAAARLILVLVLAALGVVMWAGFTGDFRGERLIPAAAEFSFGGLLQASGLLFFAFAGYARVATLGEEVVDPVRTIPRSILIALGATLVIYAGVLSAVVGCLPRDELVHSTTPLGLAVASRGHAVAETVVRAGAILACFGVLLSLLAGIGRTTFAMAANGDLPAGLAAVHPRTGVPHRAEIAIGIAVAVIVSAADVRTAIGFSSFAILLYYAIANAACWTLPAGERRWSRWLAAAGLCCCLAIVPALPPLSALGGLCCMATGALVFAVQRRLRRRPAEAAPDPAR